MIDEHEVRRIADALTRIADHVAPAPKLRRGDPHPKLAGSITFATVADCDKALKELEAVGLNTTLDASGAVIHALRKALLMKK